MGKFGLTEFVIIIFILLLLFGGKRLPGIFKAIGGSIRNFRSEFHEKEKDDNDPENK
jgi:sec-independent protein translocase protein TatA